MTDRSLSLISSILDAFIQDSEGQRLTNGQKYAVKAQIKNGFSKRFIPNEDEDAQGRSDAAWALFMKMNGWAGEVNHDFDQRINADESVLTCLNYAREALGFLNDNPPDLIQICKGLNPGPGSVADSFGNQIDTSWFGKLYENTRTASNSGVQKMVTSILSSHGLWASAEQHRVLVCELENEPPAVVGQDSIYFTVRKNAQIDRGCCKEPTDNMLLQKGTGDYLVRLLKDHLLLDITTQDNVNQRLAYYGSLGATAGGRVFCTIDGTSCSDTIVPNLVKYLLGPKWFSWLSSIRSPYVSYAVTPGDEPERIKLNMMSTMGNGFTFPLQTMIFSAIVLGVLRFYDYTEHDYGLVSKTGSTKTWGVFGDDIIVDEDVYDMVVSVLTACGIIVNPTKSFRGRDPFRESCGADYYHGYDVRPVFVQSLKTVQDRMSFLNRLVIWGYKHSIDLPNVCRVLVNSIPQSVRYPIPGREAVDSGIILSRTLFDAPWTARTVRSTAGRPPQEVERLLGLGSIDFIGNPMYDGFTYKRFVPQPNLVRKFKKITTVYGWDELVLSDDKLLAILAGALSTDGCVTIRSEVTRFNSRYGYTPSWGALTPSFNKRTFDCLTYGMKPWDIDVSRYSSMVSANYESYLERCYALV